MKLSGLEPPHDYGNTRAAYVMFVVVSLWLLVRWFLSKAS